MRSLIDFIRESVENQSLRISDLKITYTAKKYDVVIEVPDNFSEDDIQVYLSDVCLSKMPGSSENTKNIFDPYIEYISDAYFEYDRFELVKGYTPDIEYDQHYDDSTVDSNHLYLYKLVNLRYIIIFSQFDVDNVDKNNLKTELYEILKTTESNDINKYPYKIELKKENIDYRNYEEIDK